MVLKMLLLLKLNKHTLRLALLLTALISGSCASKLELSNKKFLGQYGSKVDRINKSRQRAAHAIEEPARQGEARSINWANPARNMGINGTFTTRSAYLDTSVLKGAQRPEEFLPNLDTLMQGKQMQDRIPEIFDVSYTAENYPKTYKKRHVSFDDIDIPGHDYFGIKSSLNKKQYNMVDNRILQENIDYLDGHLDKDTREINLIILREKEEIRRKKLARLILGEEEKIEEEEIEEESAIESFIDDATDVITDGISGFLDINPEGAAVDVKIEGSVAEDGLPPIPNPF
jgi:hypothetical protein